MLPSDDLAGGNGLYSLATQLSGAIGSALGGAATPVVGVAVVFSADAVSFWFSALAI